MRRFGCAVMIVLCFGATAFADIYKCVSEDGKVKYSDEPCSKKAEVAFKTEELNFDAVIGNASPYPKLPIPTSQYDTEAMLVHAKKIGAYIIPGEYNNDAQFLNFRYNRQGPHKIFLHFGPTSDNWRYTVKMTYKVVKKLDGMYVWLHSFEIKKHNKPYNPQSMDHVKTFKKMGKGVWEIKNKGSNWP